VERLAVTMAETVANADVVILATPPRAILDLLPSVDALAHSEAILMDVGSVKKPIVDSMASLPGSHRAIGGHPIAGDERSGPDAARPSLFEGHPFVLCRSGATSDRTNDIAREVVAAVGAVPVEMGASTHDQVLGRTSHVPQVLSTALALTLQPGDSRLGGRGLRDMTRLAGSDPVMWRDILLLNREEILAALHALNERLHGLSRDIESANAAAIEVAFRDAGMRAAGPEKVTA
jgi:prephenate dehydrogenase